MTYRIRTLLLAVSCGMAAASPTYAQTVAAGAAHTVVATPDGSVWTFGYNYFGQLGDGTSTARRSPVPVASLGNIIAVAAGSQHTLALASDGTVWAWGRNASGQLGNNSTANSYTPIVVGGLPPISAIAAGDAHSVALAADGTIWTWGANASGQLGNGATTASLVPLMLPTGWSATAIGAGQTHTLAIRTDGTLWGWGANGSGQLGAASPAQWTSPAQVAGVTGALSVAGGSCHTALVRSDGRVLTSGCNTSGQLGDNTTTSRPSMGLVLSLENAVRVRAGYAFTSALTASGEVWSWGQNFYGQIGNGSTLIQKVPARTLIGDVVTQVGAGHYHGVAATTAGVVFTWGYNADGQLGDGTTLSRPTPVAISDVNYAWKVATPTLSLAAGTYYTDTTVTVSVATAGVEIHYTTNGDDPTLGDSTVASGGALTLDRSMVLKVRAWKTGMPPSSVATAIYTMQVSFPSITPSSGTYTQPQTATVTTTTPNAVLRYTTGPADAPPPAPDESSPIYATPLQFSTSTTLKVAGFRTGWSSSSVNTATYRMNFGTLAAPEITPGGGAFPNPVTVTLSAAPGTIIRYTTNGLAPSIYSPAYAGPFTVSTAQTVKAIATHPDYVQSPVASSSYTFVVAAPVFSPAGGTYPAGQTATISSDTEGATIRYTLDGRDPTTSDAVIGSGSALFIGNFTLKARAWKTGFTDSAITTATYQLSGAITPHHVDGGGDRSIAVRSDGIVWAWGARPGNGTGWSVYPLRVTPMTGAKVVAAGGNHSLVALVDGSVYAWGKNTSGQLGDGSTTDRLTPVLLSSIAGVTTIAGGASFSVAVKTDGSVWTWGANGSGQLGDGTTTPRSLPAVVAGLTAVSAVAAGDQFVVALKTNGTVWTWGHNQYGQLGDGTTTNRLSPIQISGLSNVVAVAAGANHALALGNNGSVVAWGANGAGQLGDGSTTQRLTPVSVGSLGSIGAIAAGGSHSMALTSAGLVWSWGANGDGQLGDGTYTSRSTPGSVNDLFDIAGIAAGAKHSLAISTDGRVWTWGENWDGQLGDGSYAKSNTPRQISGPNLAWRPLPPSVSPASGVYTVEQTVTITTNDPGATLHYTTSGATPTDADPVIASGGTLLMSQSTTLHVNAWRPGAPPSDAVVRSYELKVPTPGIAPATGSYSGPVTVTLTDSNAQATMRYTLDGTEPTPASPTYAAPFTVAQSLTLKAAAYRTGWTSSEVAYGSYWVINGTAATPTVSPAAGGYSTPQLVTLASATDGATIRYTLDGSNPVETSPVYRFPFIVSTSTTVKARAFKAGMLPSAVASATYVLDVAGWAATPTILPAGGRFTTRQTVSVQAPAGATLRYTVDGRDPTEDDALVGAERTIVVDRSMVLKVRAWDGGLGPSAVRSAFFVITGQVAAGDQHTLALKTDGTVWSWGHNADGRLGDGTTTTRLSPVQVGLSDVTAVAGGLAHSLALTRAGTVWAWGLNNCGQLGDGTTTSRSTPVQVSGLTGVIAIAAGGEEPFFAFSHSLALKADGTVWAWGCNGSGQLGDGTTMGRHAPVRVIGLEGVTGIAAGGRHSMALVASGGATGTVWTWGDNDWGQLGDGSTISRSVAVVLPDLDVIEIAASSSGALARRNDGTVWRWGGVRLDGMPRTPTPMPLLERIVTIGTGRYHMFALDRDAMRWGWGSNSSGQLATRDSWVSTVTGLASNRVREPVPVTLMLAGGRDHSALLRVDGTVAATGDNQYGQLGDGTTTDASQPVVVPGLSLAENAWLALDNDNDGLPNWREWLAGTDPYRFDTNGNGTPDGLEEILGPNAANPDTDLDGLPNWLELQLGTDPLAADTDGDSVPDGVDAFPLDPTRSALPPPAPGDTTPPVITLTEPTTARPAGGGGGG